MLVFVFLGLVGGVAYVWMWAKEWKDLFTFYASKRMVLGAVVGGVYGILYSEYNFPNSIMCFVSGYAATDFIESIVERFKKKK